MKLIKNYKEGKLTSVDVRTVNNTVICLMALVAVTSIIWSTSIHILTGDFYNGIIGAKLSFRERDFAHMDERAKRILQRDLESILNGTYSDEAAKAITLKKKQIEEPKVRKALAHLYRISHNWNVTESNDAAVELQEANVTTSAPHIQLDLEKDRKFLKNMTVDVAQTRWNQSAAVQFVYSFPFLSEMTAIIWAAMCLIFQSGVKKYWGLPKPWRIVVPSILIFAVMSIGSVTYTIYANSYLKAFCTDLRASLHNPEALSCGQAIALLRPAIKPHVFSHTVYLNLFRVSYVFSMICWLLALLIMLLRYFYAIDFQLVDILYASERKKSTDEVKECSEIFLSTPKHQTDMQRIARISEDDYQSAKSHLSEVALPLLDNTIQTKTEVQ